MSTRRSDLGVLGKLLFVLVICDAVSCGFHDQAIGGSAIAGGRVENNQYLVCTGKFIGQQNQAEYKEVSQLQWSLLFTHELFVIISSITFLVIVLPVLHYVRKRNKFEQTNHN